MKKNFYLVCCLTAILYGCSLDEVIDVGDVCPPNIFVDDDGYLVNRLGVYSNAIGESLVEGQKRIKVVNRTLMDEEGYNVDKQGNRVDNAVSFSANLANFKTFNEAATLQYMILTYGDAQKFHISEDSLVCSLENGCLNAHFDTYLKKSRCPDNYPTCSLDGNGAYFCMVGTDNPNNIVCDGEWINPQTESQYCGASGTCLGEERGTICKVNEICSAGRCVKISSALCEGNQHSFDDSCEDDSVENCGLHGKNCLNNSGWLDGECVSKQCVATQCDEASGYMLEGTRCVSSCLPGEVKCDGECRDPQTDSKYCGAKGTPLSCDDVGDVCEDGFSCVEGHCAIDCPENLTTCVGESGAYCTDITRDINNCTGCGMTCSTSDYSNSVSLFCKDGCVIESCEEGYHLYNNTCEPNTAENCGSHGYACSEHNVGWKSGTCSRDGFCEATECASETGYHLSGIRCVADTRECCGDSCKTCNAVELCSNGKCSTLCNDPLLMCIRNNSAYCANIAVDPDNCGECGKTCSLNSVKNAAEVYCDNGCKASACNPGYHIYNHQCEKDDEGNCGSHGVKCNVGNADNSCQNGRCNYLCQDGYHSYGDGCEKDDADNCGSHGYRCSSNVDGWETGICEANKCIAKSCLIGYHLDGQQCAADTKDACGPNKVKCQQSEFCMKGKCSSSCDSPMTQCGSACVNTAYDRANCGACNNVCARSNALASYCTNSVCRASACKPGYYLYNGECKQNDELNCGSYGRACSVSNASNRCDKETGQCKFTCNNGFHVYNGGCEPNTVSNCGSHGVVCRTDNADDKCSDSAGCSFVCHPGYHVYDKLGVMGCVADTVEHCGSQGNACTALAGWNGGICNQGKCVATSCRSGYCLSGGVCKAGSGDAAACGIKGGTSQCAVCSSTQYCADGACASKKYGPNVCESAGGNTYTKCGTNCTDCQTLLPNSVGGVCTSSGECYATSCKSGYHPYNGRCEIDSVTNCGYNGVACSLGMFVGATEVDCKNAACVAKTCDRDSLFSYHLYNGSCEADSRENCTVHGKTCTTADIPGASTAYCWYGKCQAYACGSGYTITGSLNARTSTCVKQ